jgi:hypothetical protein
LGEGGADFAGLVITCTFTGLLGATTWSSVLATAFVAAGLALAGVSALATTGGFKCCWLGSLCETGFRDAALFFAAGGRLISDLTHLFFVQI